MTHRQHFLTVHDGRQSGDIVVQCDYAENANSVLIPAVDHVTWFDIQRSDIRRGSCKETYTIRRVHGRGGASHTHSETVLVLSSLEDAQEAIACLQSALIASPAACPEYIQPEAAGLTRSSPASFSPASSSPASSSPASSSPAGAGRRTGGETGLVLKTAQVAFALALMCVAAAIFNSVQAGHSVIADRLGDWAFGLLERHHGYHNGFTHPTAVKAGQSRTVKTDAEEAPARQEPAKQAGRGAADESIWNTPPPKQPLITADGKPLEPPPTMPGHGDIGDAFVSAVKGYGEGAGNSEVKKDVTAGDYVAGPPNGGGPVEPHPGGNLFSYTTHPQEPTFEERVGVAAGKDGLHGGVPKQARGSLLPSGVDAGDAFISAARGSDQAGQGQAGQNQAGHEHP